MKELIRKFETIWISVAFAEAGEQETAQEFMGGTDMYEADKVESCQTV